MPGAIRVAALRRRGPGGGPPLALMRRPRPRPRAAAPRRLLRAAPRPCFTVRGRQTTRPLNVRREPRQVNTSTGTPPPLHPIQLQCLSYFLYSRSYTLLIPVVGIVIEPNVWRFMTSPPSLKRPAGSDRSIIGLFLNVRLNTRAIENSGATIR